MWKKMKWIKNRWKYRLFNGGQNVAANTLDFAHFCSFSSVLLHHTVFYIEASISWANEYFARKMNVEEFWIMFYMNFTLFDASESETDQITLFISEKCRMSQL